MLRVTLFLISMCLCVSAFAQDASPSRLHANVLVFVPAYEGSQLWDTTLDRPGQPVCVWGNLNTFFSARSYFALRLPNPLEARTMRSVGPVDIYGHFLSTLTHPDPRMPGFVPYTLGVDLFVFDYDWRRDLAVTAPLLGQALKRYAAIHARLTGGDAAATKFVIVTHSMGGLVARTLLSQEPGLAPRVAGMYLVGSPNAGSVKAVRTVVCGPDSLKADTHGFPGALLNLLPTDVDQNVTKLTGITRPSLYELLPTGDPAWTRIIDGHRGEVPDAFALDPWRRYWPTAALEKKVFVDGWLAQREAEGRKLINPADWIYCQSDAPLAKLLAQARAWRTELGSLQRTSDLLASPGQSTRLRLIVGTGLKTASGVVTSGAHDLSGGFYTYTDGDGDGTVESRRALESLSASAPNVKLLHGVPHGKLMGNAEFLAYLEAELSRQTLVETSTRTGRAPGEIRILVPDKPGPVARLKSQH